MEWEIYPQGLANFLLRTAKEYTGDLPIYVTENGAAFGDGVGPDGRCHDEKRVRYLRGHIEQTLAAKDEGVPVEGYFCWSTLDNFEWAYGYKMRFGVIHVDYETQQRTIKDSGYFLQSLAEGRAQR